MAGKDRDDRHGDKTIRGHGNVSPYNINYLIYRSIKYLSNIFSFHCVEKNNNKLLHFKMFAQILIVNKTSERFLIQLQTTVDSQGD